MDRANELREYLTDQYKALQSSGRAYDAGEMWESKRITVALRILIHETRNSHSLLKQLEEVFGIRPQILSRDSKTITLSTLFYIGAMVKVEMSASGSKVTAEPMMDLDYPTLYPIDYNEWWQQIVIVAQGYTFKRRDIMLSLADQDGGAHVDRALATGYRKLTREHLASWRDSEGRPVPNLHLAMARENGFYMAHAIEEYFGHLLV